MDGLESLCHTTLLKDDEYTSHIGSTMPEVATTTDALFSVRRCDRISSTLFQDSMVTLPRLRHGNGHHASVFHIENYIAVGSLRLTSERDVPNNTWEPCDSWQLIPLYSQCANSEAEDLYKRTVQNLLHYSAIAPHDVTATCSLVESSWIRLQFKKNHKQGQVRVYVLPHDVGRKLVYRDDPVLKRAFRSLLSLLDIGGPTWNGIWSEDDPSRNMSSFLKSHTVASHGTSLLEIFNRLPSPDPNPAFVKDRCAQSAMRRLIRGDIEGLKTSMMHYQRRSAALMLQREAQPHQVLDPRLVKTKDQNGYAWYFDPAEGLCFRDPRYYDAPSGGICAETMGLGKTLICLALILATKDQSSRIPPEHSVGTIPVRPKIGSLVDMSAAAITRTGTPWKGHFRAMRSRGLDHTKCVDAIQANPGTYTLPPPENPGRRKSARSISLSPDIIYLSTTSLVVVPPNLVRQWEYEIAKHTTGLKVLVMIDIKKELLSPKELLDYDIILFSRQRFEAECRDSTDICGPRSSRLPIEMTSSTHNVEMQRLDYFDANKPYKSPLRAIRFKRLITDEGHVMGNASSSTKNNAVIVVDFLQVASKWVISGTPAPGLFGAQSSFDFGSRSNCLRSPTSAIKGTAFKQLTPPLLSGRSRARLPIHEHEHNDLVKLGNIASVYLKAHPWCDNYKLWSQYVMQPKHSKRSMGTPECLLATLEGMIVRHRFGDVEREVQLPPLYRKAVYLDGSLQDKISLNLFSMVINTNAVTSERKDVDYMFHHKQRKALLELVSNLRMASFFWSGFSASDVISTIGNIQRYLEKFSSYPEASLSEFDSDRVLLQQALESGKAAINNTIWQCSSSNHDLPIYLQNQLTHSARKKCSLDGLSDNPTLFGMGQMVDLQKKLAGSLNDYDLMRTLEQVGLTDPNGVAGNRRLNAGSHKTVTTKAKKLIGMTSDSLGSGGAPDLLDPLDDERSRLPLKSTSINKGCRQGRYQKASSKEIIPSVKDWEVPLGPEKRPIEHSDLDLGLPGDDNKEFSSRSQYRSSNGSFSKGIILSTASSKLSYLIEQVLAYHEEEKIIIFYENDTVAYYISQALDAVAVQSLIYAKTLTADRRSQYLVTFNSSPQFRCLLMDISQAAFGLDVSSASRVYFVTPVVSKQVEAQAVKRAHRIGQTRPVYVETLVLRSSIEEVIMRRREEMSSDEQKKCKTVLDDAHMYDWIKNVSFVPLQDVGNSGEVQMAELHNSKNVFERRDVHDPAIHHPDSGLVLDLLPSNGLGQESSPREPKRKRSMVMFTDGLADETPTEENVPKTVRLSSLKCGDSPDIGLRSDLDENTVVYNAPEIAPPLCKSMEMSIRESIFGPPHKR